MLRSMLQKYQSFIKFNLVGILNTLVDFIVFTILYTLGVPYKLAQCISYASGTANSYLFNKKWTFASKPPEPAMADDAAIQGKTTGCRELAQLLRFLLINLLSLGLSLLLLHLFKEKWGFHPLLAKGIITIFTTLVNFIGSRLWVFRKEKD